MRLWLHVANRLKALRLASLAIESSNARRVAAGALATWRQQYGLKRKHHSALLRAVAAMMNRLKRQAFTSLRAHVEKKKQVCCWEGKYCISSIKVEQDLSELSHGHSLLSCSCMFSYYDYVPFFI